MKTILLISLILLLSGCIQEGKWFGIVGEQVTIDNTGNELQNKYACADKIEEIMLKEGIDYNLNREAVPEIISVSCRGDICLCQ